jgi:Protein of unknown function (DUF992)
MLAIEFAKPAAAQQVKAGVKAGVLTCDVSAGMGFIIGSQKSVSCAFVPEGTGRREDYDGDISKWGFDVGFTQGGVMQCLVDLLPSCDCDCLLRWAQIRATQVFIDLDEFCVEIICIGDDCLNLLPFQQQGSLISVLPSDDHHFLRGIGIVVASHRAHDDGRLESNLLHAPSELLDYLFINSPPILWGTNLAQADFLNGGHWDLLAAIAPLLRGSILGRASTHWRRSSARISVRLPRLTARSPPALIASYNTVRPTYATAQAPATV